VLLSIDDYRPDDVDHVTLGVASSHVLLSIDDYRRLSGTDADVVEWLSMEDDADFEPAPARLNLRKPGL
jgi:hypothetical protein